MKKLYLAMLAILAVSPMAHCASLAVQPQGHTFTVKNDQFLLDGKPFQVISGEMHYVRTPHEYWRARLKAAKAMGLNAITTYVFWNRHEEKPGVYDFSGDNDIVEFIREAQEEGLFVILRPGPYVCAEWEFGGFPAWLLQDHKMVIRSKDPAFLAAVTRWFNVLGPKLKDLQASRGGPIIAIQVENEYGSFGDDKEYMEAIHSAIVNSGLNETLLYTADGADNLAKGSLPELPAVVNFGSGDTQSSFAALQNLRPDGPMMAGEYWVGWFDAWGKPHSTVSADKVTSDVSWMLNQGHSVSLYMFHGGTSFGGMNGANSDGTNYMPYVTSYDYDSPLDESGRSTPKFEALRDVITKATGITPPAFPTIPAPISVPDFKASAAVSLWDVLPVPLVTENPMTMEDLGQSYGWILYRTILNHSGNGVLTLNGINDYAQVYLDKRAVGTVDRRLKQTQLTIHAHAGMQLDILVQNSGRINYTKALRGERKGINGSVEFMGKIVNGWQNYSLPMDKVDALPYSEKTCSGPCFYRAEFEVPAPADTFLDTRALGKGLVWLNGHGLGRFWKVGPQGALYVPGVWLNAGKNTLHYFDLNGNPNASLRGLNAPLLNMTAAD